MAGAAAVAALEAVALALVDVEAVASALVDVEVSAAGTTKQPTLPFFNPREETHLSLLSKFLGV